MENVIKIELKYFSFYICVLQTIYLSGMSQNTGSTRRTTSQNEVIKKIKISVSNFSLIQMRYSVHFTHLISKLILHWAVDLFRLQKFTCFYTSLSHFPGIFWLSVRTNKAPSAFSRNAFYFICGELYLYFVLL